MMHPTRRLLQFAAVALLLATCRSGYRDVAQYSIEQFLNTTAVGGSSFSSDESSLLYHSNESGIYNAYTLPVGGGESSAMTHSEDNSVFTTAYFPNDNRMLLRSDQAGNEIWHIYLREENGELTDLTPGEEARSLFAGWSHDLTGFYYRSNRRDPKYMDLYFMDIGSFQDRLLYENDAGYEVSAISNDGLQIVLSKTHTTSNTDLYLHNLSSGETTHLTPHEGEISFSAQDFTSDGDGLYVLTDEESEYAYLVRFDLASGEREIVEQVDWDITYAGLSWNGTYLVLGINNNARTETRIYEVATGKQIRLPQLPAGDIISPNISRSERLMAFYHNGSTSPNNLYVYNFEDRSVTRLTRTLNPEMVEADLVQGQTVAYPSFDGLEIPAILYKPLQIKPGELAPALIWVHGGPGGQSRIRYSSLIQYLVNHGYVILAVNNRGSSGYGKTFFGLDDRRHGEDDLLDCIRGKDFLTGTGYVDGQRIGIIGGSYGGYMTLAALTLQPEAFALGVDMFGISNWVRTLQSIPPWWESFREALYKELGDPAEDMERLRRISPLFNAERIVRPLMVLQGANDPRVLKVESDEIVAAARANDVPVEYIVFDDEGHGFVKKENRIVAYRAILEFLDTYLQGT